MDYELLEEKIIVLVAKDESTGATLAYECLAKDPAGTWVVTEFGRATRAAYDEPSFSPILFIVKCYEARRGFI